MGGACGATPRLAAAGCAKACCPDAGGTSPVRHDGRFTDTRPALLMELPRRASCTSPQAAARGVLTFRWGVGLARVRARASEAVARRCRVGHVSFRERSACTSLVCCESWRGHGCALGFMAATFQRKQFPRLCHYVRRLPRGTNSFRFPVLHCVATAARCDPPIPRRPDHNKDALARSCSTRKENHHG